MSIKNASEKERLWTILSVYRDVYQKNKGKVTDGFIKRFNILKRQLDRENLKSKNLTVKQ